MKIDVEKRLRERFSGLAPDPGVRDLVLSGLARERRSPRRAPHVLYAALAAAACLLIVAALWNGGGNGERDGRPEEPRARLLLTAEAEPDAVSRTLAARLSARGYEGAEVRLAGPGGGLEVLFPRDIPVEVVEALMVRPGTLEFRLVVEAPEGGDAPEGHRWVDRADGGDAILVVDPEDSRDRFGGEDLDPEAVEAVGGLHGWMVRFSVREGRKAEFEDFTRRSLKRKLAIIVDGVAESAPVIQSVLPGRGQISGGGVGGFTREEAESLAAVLRSGPLPAEVRPRK